MHRDVGFRNRCRFNVADTFGHGKEQIFRNRDIFGLRSATGQAKNALARLQARAGWLLDHARKLQTRDVGRRIRRRRILAAPLRHIRAIEACSRNSHQRLFRLWLWLWQRQAMASSPASPIRKAFIP